MATKKNPAAAPAFVTPMAAIAVKDLPEGEDWLYEVKWDGYRALIIKDVTRVQVQSRNHKDLTNMYPGVAAGGRAPGMGRVIPPGAQGLSLVEGASYFRPGSAS